jgi:hypothetical protein
MSLPEWEVLTHCGAVAEGSSLLEVLRMFVDGSITHQHPLRFRCFAENVTAAVVLARLYCWEITEIDAIGELLDEK